MDVVIPKKLNFLKSPSTPPPAIPTQDKSGKKLNFILPKPRPDNITSSKIGGVRDDIPVTPMLPELGNVSSTTETKNITDQNQQFILQPMYTLSYKPIEEEPLVSSKTEEVVESTGFGSNSSNFSMSILPSTGVEENRNSRAAVRHKLPFIVAQRPSSYGASRQISPKKDTSLAVESTNNAANSNLGEGMSLQPSDLSIAQEENPNVIRCRNYRDRKR